MAFQNNAFQQNAFQSAGENTGAGTSRGRRVAYGPTLDVAIRAHASIRFRKPLRRLPDSLTQRRRQQRLTSKTDLSQINSSSYGAQTAYDQPPKSDGGAPGLFLFE